MMASNEKKLAQRYGDGYQDFFPQGAAQVAKEMECARPWVILIQRGPLRDPRSDHQEDLRWILVLIFPTWNEDDPRELAVAIHREVFGENTMIAEFLTFSRVEPLQDNRHVTLDPDRVYDEFRSVPVCDPNNGSERAGFPVLCSRRVFAKHELYLAGLAAHLFEKDTQSDKSSCRSDPPAERTHPTLDCATVAAAPRQIAKREKGSPSRDKTYYESLFPIEASHPLLRVHSKAYHFRGSREVIEHNGKGEVAV